MTISCATCAAVLADIGIECDRSALEAVQREQRSWAARVDAVKRERDEALALLKRLGWSESEEGTVGGLGATVLRLERELHEARANYETALAAWNNEINERRKAERVLVAAQMEASIWKETAKQAGRGSTEPHAAVPSWSGSRAVVEAKKR